MTDYPACFNSSDQYREWKTLAFRSNLQSFFICTDCTPKYQAEMIAARRCQDRYVDVRALHKSEKENDIRQEVLQDTLETFNDPWANMLVGLSVWGAPPAPTKKGKNEPTV